MEHGIPVDDAQWRSLPRERFRSLLLIDLEAD
jgi:hypothetical protein